MPTGLTEIELEQAARNGACAAGVSTVDVLRLLSGGATGAILMVLGEQPLRTMSLTKRVPDFSSRTIYRHAGRLAELNVVERIEEQGVPSKVVYMLSDPCGAELYELVNRFADASLTRLPDGRIDAHAWASLGLFADLWETGMVEELNSGARSSTQLAQANHQLSYHQVSRRIVLFQASGLLRQRQGSGPRPRYELTEKARRKMGLVVGIARWRQRHVVTDDDVGMTPPEMSTVLRASLPLARLPEHRRKCLCFSVRGGDHVAAAEDEDVWAEVGSDGTVHSCASPPADPDARGAGGTENWIPVVLDGETDAVEANGEKRVIADCLAALYESLWAPGAALSLVGGVAGAGPRD